ncbi:MAG: ATP-binding protein, partial [Thiobacillaceae bacterium]|nr:ATP-binding protein [Thiobacillaceae bacterium]
SGIGLLLIIPMAAAGLQPQPRRALFLAALGTLAVLLEQSLQSLVWQGDGGGYLRAGLLALGFFTVSTLSHILAKGALSSARLAGEKAAEAQSLARINDRVIQELQEGVLVIDAQGRILQHNGRAEALLGCTLHNRSHVGTCADNLARLWQQWQASGSNPDLPFTIAEGPRRLRARFSALDPGRDAGAMILLQDLTELEREAQNMKLASLGRLTANLAHEIRNPLAAIHQAASLLEEEPATPTMSRLTRIIIDNARRLDRLVEDVLSVNRRDRAQKETVELADFLHDFVEQFAQTEQMPTGVIALTVAPGLRIVFDRLHLTQILWNLMRNAWRYCTRAQGSIRLHAVAAENAVWIEVFNDGAPIPPELRKHLFEPFYTTEVRGTGLGLYIARELAEANGGALSYVDQNEGTLFRLSCAPAPAVAVAGAAPPQMQTVPS